MNSGPRSLPFRSRPGARALMICRCRCRCLVLLPYRGRASLMAGMVLPTNWRRNARFFSCEIGCRTRARARTSCAGTRTRIEYGPSVAGTPLCFADFSHPIRLSRVRTPPSCRILSAHNEKAPGLIPGLSFFNPATTYSPTSLPMQYHRRWRA